MKKTSKQIIEKSMFFDDLPRQEGQESMPAWLFGGLIVVLTVVLQVWGAMSWPTGLPRASGIRAGTHLGPILGPSWPFVGASWGRIGPKMGRLGRILGHGGALLEARGGILRQILALEAPSSSLHQNQRKTNVYP